jgi:hypothetical protein
MLTIQARAAEELFGTLVKLPVVCVQPDNTLLMCRVTRDSVAAGGGDDAERVASADARAAAAAAAADAAIASADMQRTMSGALDACSRVASTNADGAAAAGASGVVVADRRRTLSAALDAGRRAGDARVSVAMPSAAGTGTSAERLQGGTPAWLGQGGSVFDNAPVPEHSATPATEAASAAQPQARARLRQRSAGNNSQSVELAVSTGAAPRASRALGPASTSPDAPPAAADSAPAELDAAAAVEASASRRSAASQGTSEMPSREALWHGADLPEGLAQQEREVWLQVVDSIEPAWGPDVFYFYRMTAPSGLPGHAGCASAVLELPAPPVIQVAA